MRIEDDVAETLIPYPILAIACDQNICTMVQEVLELEGYADVRKAVLGRGAFQMLRQLPGQMIVLLEPIVLSAMGNETLQSYLTDVGRRARHVVIVMAGMACIEGYTRKMHFDGFLQMPFPADKLVATVEHAQRLARAKRNRTIH